MRKTVYLVYDTHKTRKQRNCYRPTGPDGNAFVLMGMAKNFAKQLGKDGKAIAEEMMAGDYEHLLFVFDREFGDYVILER